MIRTWIKIFYRNSKNNKLNIIINILGLTLGFAGLLLVLLYFNYEESYDKWNPNKDIVYRVVNKSRSDGISYTAPSGQAQFFKSDIPEVEQSVLIGTVYRYKMFSLDDKKVFSKRIIYTEPSFFDFFPFEIIEGSIVKFEESRSHIAISEKFAKKFFGSERATGNMMTVDGKTYTIACVYTVPGNSHYDPEVLIQNSKPFDVNWGDYNNELFCKISEGSDIAEVNNKMNQIIVDKTIKPYLSRSGMSLAEYDDKYGIDTVLLESLNTLHLHNISNNAGPGGNGNYKLLLMLLGLSVLLIIISCVNFINLSTASASQRAKEVGVKKTLGLSKKQLIIQYVSEILVQGLLSLILAFVIVELTLPYFNDFINVELSIANMSVLLTVITIAFFTCVFIGLIPAVYLSNFKAIEVLKGNVSRSKKGIIVRNAMLLLQFLISGFFLIGVLIIYSQISYMVNKDLGFNKDKTIVVNIYNVEDKYKKYELIKKVLSDHKNVEGISASMFIPGDGNLNNTRINHGDYSFSSGANSVDFNYTDFANIKILKGRALSENLTSDTISSILINETAAKLLHIYDNPIGKKATIAWPWKGEDRQLEIVGMIKDYHFDGFDADIDPLFLIHWNTFPFSKNWMGYVQFKLKGDDLSKTISEIEKLWVENVDSKYPFSYEFLDKKFAKTYEKYEKQQTMFLVLSVIVIIISMLGLFALATLTIQHRLKEVAIRKTLGASVKEIIFQLIKNFLKITLISSVILLPISYLAMQNWLDSFSYKIDMPLWPYVLTPILLVVLVLAVVGFKAFRATKISLIKYLKFE